MLPNVPINLSTSTCRRAVPYPPLLTVSVTGGPKYFYAPGEPARPLSILVVDDDASIRHTIADILIDEGYYVRCAADGLEALSVLGVRF
jgi:hypothetical protein